MKKPTPKPIDVEITRVLEELSRLDPTTKEYSRAVDNLKVLYESRTKPPATWAGWQIIGATFVPLLEIIIIVGFEQVHVLTSKALSRVGRH